ncbi:LamB/YcsF family protein [Amphritea sp. HPY]|uniref:LamB/YcsF family protein n=1 Tax=Amphritea sp. HPY TaxID=3421652 RepID=UPI003D7E2301
MSISVNINCDMGESFGLYKMGEDEKIMPFISEANVACGFHGSDPNHMAKTLRLAKEHGVKVGAHFSLPDLQGFGRREMKIDRDEMKNIIIYQIGALKGFLDEAGMQLNHLKPHGALYGMAAKYEETAHAVADAAQIFNVPVFGLSGTLHEDIFKARGIEFIPEFFADLDYDRNGNLIITREHHAVSPQDAADKCYRAVTEGVVRSVDGIDIDVNAKTICVHSDTPNAIAVAEAVKSKLASFIS